MRLSMWISISCGVAAGCGGSGGNEDAQPDAGPACAPASLFVPVAAHPDNQELFDELGLPAPMLEVECAGDELVVRSNGVPSFPYQDMVTPYDPGEFAYEWRVPLAPAVAAAPTPLPAIGTIGFSIDGLPLFVPNEGLNPHPYGDTVNNALNDWCGGHTGKDREYHHHVLPSDDLGDFLEDCVTEDLPPGTVLGFALDGFPIYGPADGVHSGWQEVFDPSTYVGDAYAYVASDDPTQLDECNGRVQPDGSYGYHLTAQYPYTLGCFRGTSNPALVGVVGANQSVRSRDATFRRACDADPDCNTPCAGAECACPRGSDCGCVALPIGDRCAMRCASDADCVFESEDGSFELICDEPLGICVAEIGSHHAW